MADLDNALDTLGLDHTADAQTARRRFRLLLKQAHPDRGGDPAVVRRLVAAYGIVADAIERDGLPSPAHPPPVPAVQEEPEEVVELDIPAEGLFLRLHEALDDVATVTGADPENGWIEAIIEGPLHAPAQLTVRLAPDPDGTKLLFTLDSLDGRLAPSLDTIVERVAAAARRVVPGHNN